MGRRSTHFNVYQTKTNSSPSETGLPQKDGKLSQPHLFWCYASFRECTSRVFYLPRVFFFFGQLFFVDPRMVRLVDCGGSPKLGRKNSEDGSVVLTPYIWLCIFTNACMAVCQFLMFFFCGRVNAQWSCVGPKSVWRTPSLVISPGSFTTAAWPCRGQVICMNTS